MKLACSLFCAVSLIGAVACGGSNNEAKDPSSTASNAPTTPATPPSTDMAANGAPSDMSSSTGMGATGATGSTSSTSSMGSNGTAAAGSMAAPAADSSATLTDEQIVAISDAANTSEINAAKMAQSKAKNPAVKKFASMMIQHHTDAKNKGAKTAAKFKMTPSDSALSTQMKSDAQSEADTLKGKSGPDFDKAYIDAQVKDHTDVLNVIDTKLLPNVKNAELKSELQDLRPKVEAHLKEAQDLQKKLQ